MSLGTEPLYQTDRQLKREISPFDRKGPRWGLGEFQIQPRNQEYYEVYVEIILGSVRSLLCTTPAKLCQVQNNNTVDCLFSFPLSKDCIFVIQHASNKTSPAASVTRSGIVSDRLDSIISDL